MTKPLTLDTFRQANRTPGPGRCSLAEFVSTLSPADRVTLAQAIRDESIQVLAIHRVLKGRGFTYGDEVIRRHRREGCAFCSWLKA